MKIGGRGAAAVLVAAALLWGACDRVDAAAGSSAPVARMLLMALDLYGSLGADPAGALPPGAAHLALADRDNAPWCRMHD